MEANDLFLKRIYGKQLFPTILAVLGGTINVFFDGILVGQKLGAEGLAAVSLCLPIFLLLCTAGSLIGSGASILSSKEQGQGHSDNCLKIYRLSLSLMLIFGVFFTIVGLLFLEPLCGFSIKDPALYPLVYSYAAITIIGALPKMLLYLPFYYLRLDGKSQLSMLIMLVMTFLNITGDWFFLFVLNTGIGGAALASVLSTLTACILGFAFLQRKGSLFPIGLAWAKFTKIWELLSLGSPAALNNFLSAVRVMALNFILLSTGGSVTVAVFAVVNTLSEFSYCIIGGVPQAAVPFLGIYAVEHNNSGIRFLVKQQIKTGLFLTAAYSLVLVLFSGMIGTWFGVEENLTLPIFCLGISLIFALCNSVMTVLYNCSGRVSLANTITFLRLAGFSILFAILLPKWGFSVWLFLPIAEGLTMVFWFLRARWISHGNKKLRPILLLDDSLYQQGRVLDFSVQTSPEAICDASGRITDFCEENDLSPKTTMRISLAIEELMMVMTKKCLNGAETESMDLRVFVLQGTMGIRIRCGGIPYNPMLPTEIERNSEDYMGIKIMENLAIDILYQRTFGTNSLLILF